MLLAVCVESAAGTHASASGVSAQAAARARAGAAYAQQPLMFEANEGQAAPQVKLLAHGAGYVLLLSPHEAMLALAQPAAAQPPAAPRAPAQPSSKLGASFLRLKFLGASAATQISGREPLRARTNYLLGNDRRLWHTDVPNYSAAEYRGLYPGIDAVFHGTDPPQANNASGTPGASPGASASTRSQRLEFDFDIAPGADPSHIALQLHGARRMRLDHSGNVVLQVGAQQVVLGKPRVYQQVDGRRRDVAGRMVLGPHQTLAFALGPYDHSQHLIIDPGLDYSTFVAGGQINALAVGTDSSGHSYVYVTGTTSSGGLGAVYPNPGAYQTSCAACDFIGSAFVAKYDPSQSGSGSLIYSTYLGPAGAGVMPDELGSAAGQGIAIDANGDAYVTGYVTGSTGSQYFPTTPGALLTAMPGQQDAFVSELDPTGETLLASTYLGGANDLTGNALTYGDEGTGIALDGSDNIYLTGLTNSSGLATAGAAQSTPATGSFSSNGNSSGNPFVAKLNSSLTTLSYYTYLGGSNNTYGLTDQATAIAVDSAGEAYVVGGTYVGTCNYYVSCGAGQGGGSFPTPVTGGFQSLPGGVNEAGFLAKLNAGGTELLYLTYLGGYSTSSDGTILNAVTLDSAGDAYITGPTVDTNLPTTPGVAGPAASVCQPYGGGTICPSGIVAEVNPAASAGGSASLLFMSYLGGLLPNDNPYDTVPTGIALDSTADIYVGGYTSNTDLPEPGNPDTADSANGLIPSSALPCAMTPSHYVIGCKSAFLVEFAPGAAGSPLYYGYLAGTGVTGYESDPPVGLALDPQGNVYLAGEATSDFPTTSNAFEQAAPASAPYSYVAQIGGLPTSGGTPSNASYSYDGAAPVITGLGPGLLVTAPATTSLSVPLVVQNTGGSTFTISSIALAGSASPPWSLISVSCAGTSVPLPIPANAPVSLAAGASCVINLQFAPTQVGTGQDELLEILDTASTSNVPSPSGVTGQYLVLGGTATAAPPPAYATYSLNGTTLSQTNILLPVISLDADVNGTATAQLELTNTGGDPMTLSGVSFMNQTVTPPPWTITSITCPSGVVTPTASTPVTLEPGDACTIAMQFAPTALGVDVALLSITDNASGSTLVENGTTGQETLVTGTGGQPYASFSTTQLDFPTATLALGSIPGGGPVSAPVTVTNTGNAPLVIYGVDINNGSGVWSGASSGCTSSSGTALTYPVTLAPDASCTFTFQFAPTGPGEQSDTVAFLDNASQSNVPVEPPQYLGLWVNNLTLEGTTQYPASPYPDQAYAYFSADALSFDASGVQTQSVTITNIGGQPLTVSLVGIFGESAFTMPSSGCSTLAEDQTCTYTFQYDPSVSGESCGAVYCGDLFSGTGALAQFQLNGLSNIGAPDTTGYTYPEVFLSAPGGSLVCGNGTDLAYSLGPWVRGPRGGPWSQTISIGDTAGDLPFEGFIGIVLEGLNTTVTDTVAVGEDGAPASSGFAVFGNISSAPPLLCSGDVPGSPYLTVGPLESISPPGGNPAGEGPILPVSSVQVTFTFNEIPGEPNTAPSYTPRLVIEGTGTY